MSKKYWYCIYFDIINQIQSSMFELCTKEPGNRQTCKNYSSFAVHINMIKIKLNYGYILQEDIVDLFPDESSEAQKLAIYPM